MTADSASHLEFPDGLTKEKALNRVRRFAPHVLLHCRETHLPDKPENFNERARFRQSRFLSADRGYHTTAGWQETDEEAPHYLNVPWTIMRTESHRAFAPEALDPTAGRNVRPRDPKNIYGRRMNRGLFLERARSCQRDWSGMEAAGNCVKAPVFVDIAYDRGGHRVKVLYWFFYSLNWWKFFITHEGDWEHVSLIFTEDDFIEGNPPWVVYFAQHDHGVPIHFSKIGKKECDMGVHPVVYVDRNGHPCSPAVQDPGKYSKYWETCKGPLIPVVDCDWCDFAGAWGAIGELPYTTGPLGPLFKRHADDLGIVEKAGRRYARLPKTWRRRRWRSRLPKT